MTDVKKWKIRTTKFTVLPSGSALNHDKATDVYLDDEGGGEFVCVQQDDQTVRFDPDEWSEVRKAIDVMVLNIFPREGRE